MSKINLTDAKAELYAQECVALSKLMEHGWPKGWPQEGQLVGHRWAKYPGRILVLQHRDFDMIEGVMLGKGPEYMVNAVLKMHYPLPCWSTVGMLIEWLGDDLKSINFYLHDLLKYQVVLYSTKGRIGSLGETLILALCRAVESKMKVEAK